MASINIAIRQADQKAICKACPLDDCIGRDNRDCPIQVEQRQRWRDNYHARKGAGYFDELSARQRATRMTRRTING